MRRSLLAQMPLLTILATAIVASRAEAQKNHFMRLTNPLETQRYGPGATCTVTGLLQSPDSRKDVEALYLRVRAYRAGKEGFIIENEALIEVKKALTAVRKLATEEHIYTFKAGLRLPTGPGEYLLRVDCIDLRVRPPQNLVATQSLFIEVHATTPKR